MNPSYNNSFCKVLENISWDSYEYDTRVNGEFFITKQEWNRSIVTIINRSSAQVYLHSESYGADTIIVSRKVLDLLCCLSDFSGANNNTFSPHTLKIESGLIFYGNLGGRYKVYCDCLEKVFRKRNLILEKKDMNNTPKDFVLSFNKLKKIGCLIDVRF